MPMKSSRKASSEKLLRARLFAQDVVNGVSTSIDSSSSEQSFRPSSTFSRILFRMNNKKRHCRCSTRANRYRRHRRTPLKILNVNMFYPLLSRFHRYLAVTQPLNYSKRRRSKRLAGVMILVVWVLALAITCPPVLGW